MDRRSILKNAGIAEEREIVVAKGDVNHYPIAKLGLVHSQLCKDVFSPRGGIDGRAMRFDINTNFA